MTDKELQDRVRELRELGRSPKEIARCLGIAPARVAPAVRAIADQEEAARPAIAKCWVNRYWDNGLGVTDGRPWPGRGARTGGRGERPAHSGIASVLVARRQRTRRVAICGYLVDTWCLGVKDAFGPDTMYEPDLPAFVAHYFQPFDEGWTEAPLDLAQHIVWGAVDYAKALGFNPGRDFHRAAPHLGPLEEPCAITFGCDGTPSYVQGPFDDPDVITETLDRSVGAGNFHFLVSLGDFVDIPGFEDQLFLNG